MEPITEIIIEARLAPNRGWYLARFDVTADGVTVDECPAATYYFPSSAAARAWYDTDERLHILREVLNVPTRFIKHRD